MKVRNILKSLLIACFTIVVILSNIKIPLKAVIFGVSATNNGNGTTTVTISGACVGGFTVSAGGASASVGKTTLDSSAYVTLNTGAGTFTVTVIGNSVSDANYNVMEGQSASTTVTVTTPTAETPGGGGGGTTTPPTNNNTPNTGAENKPDTPTNEENKTDDKDATNKLSSLEVSVGTLSPKFDAQTLVYDVTAPAGTSKITINATAASEKAIVEGIGEKDVIIGDNAFDIICRAENGTTTTYTVRVHVSEKPVTTMKYNDKELGVLSGGATVSNLFEEKKIKIDGKEVSAWVNTKLNITLIYMQNGKTGEKDLYMYDTKKNEIISIYRPFAYKGKNLVMIDVPKELQKRKGMKFTNITLGDYKLSGWTFDDTAFKNYTLLYVMDEVGNTLYYQYDKKEDTLQLFSQAAALTQKDYEKLTQESDHSMLYLIIIGVLGTLSVVLLITTIAFYRKRSTMKYRKIEVNENAMSAEAKSLLHKVD